jgi:single-strand DNA-binding protein
MANFNKVILVGRLTRDPEYKPFAGGGAVCKLGFAVTNRRKNSQSGQWEDEPMFIDVEVYNRGEGGKLADLLRDRTHKGSQLMIEGRLHLDQWDDKNGGGKRSKHKIVAENVQLLDARTDGGGMGGSGNRSNQYQDDEGGLPPPAAANYGNRGNYGGGPGGGNSSGRSASPPRNNYSAPPSDDDGPGGGSDDIPF